MGVPDFSGYATRNDLKCSDGRTIRHGAFKDNEGQKVPLVWQHQYDDPSNILGHAILENRKDGVYARAFFNETPAAQNAKLLVKHGDISRLSIFANKLVSRGSDVIHGMIREVSLVLSGANPGAYIDNISFAHSDSGEDVVNEIVIYTGLEFEDPNDLEHADDEDDSYNEDDESEDAEDLEHIDTANKGDTMAAAATDTGEKTVKDVFESLSEEQKNVVYFMIGEALDGADTEAKQSDDLSDGDALTHYQEGFNMARNVFDQSNSGAGDTEGTTLSHDDLDTIVSDVKNYQGSFAHSFLAHAASLGITDIDILFPDAKNVSNSPDFIGRRTEWVSSVLDAAKHSPFSRIKSMAADITADEARAKGYVKGAMKKEEIIKLLKRVTTPATIYKKQKLDRDDMIDITDLDVVAWLKNEMRVMLDEEIARAILIGDGREVDDEDKIDEDHLRPIAHDDTMYAHQVTVQSNISPGAIIESVLRTRTFYKGTGTPTFFTTDAILTDLILLEDKVGRRLYETEQTLANALRVKNIVTVEAMESQPDLLGIVVNMQDYTVGADKGGEVSMFDDFDIDYNQYKYLMETRISGALTKPKSAVVIKRTPGTLATPTGPSFDGATNTITIPTIDGVVYEIDALTVSGNVVITETTDVIAVPDTGYSFPHNINTDWTFIYTP